MGIFHFDKPQYTSERDYPLFIHVHKEQGGRDSARAWRRSERLTPPESRT